MYKTHELTHTKEYKKYCSIKDRCYNKKCRGYKNYGEKGITFFWLDNPIDFSNYIKSLDNYGDGLTLDRINNNGNYEPGNLRWVNNHIQNANRGKSKRNKSGYIGIHWCQNKWVSNLIINKKSIFFGYYENIQDAVIVGNKYIIDNNLKEYAIQ